MTNFDEFDTESQALLSNSQQVGKFISFEDLNNSSLQNFNYSSKPVSNSFEKKSYEKEYEVSNSCKEHKDEFYKGSLNIKLLLEDIKNERYSNNYFYYYQKYTKNLPKIKIFQNSNNPFQVISSDIGISNNELYNIEFEGNIPFTYQNEQTKKNIFANISVELNTRACEISIENIGLILDFNFETQKTKFGIEINYSDALTERNFDITPEAINDYVIKNKYKAVKIVVEKIEDFIAILKYIDSETFLKYFINKIASYLTSVTSVQDLVFIYKNIPSYIFNLLSKKLPQKLVQNHINILTEYDDKGMFSFLKDESGTLIKAFKLLSQYPESINLLLNDQKSIKRIYKNLDGSSNFNGEIISNRIIFSNLIYAICAKNNFKGLNFIEREFTYGDGYKFDTNISPFSSENDDEFFIKQLKQIIKTEKVIYPDSDIPRLSESRTVKKEVFVDVDEGNVYKPLDIVYLYDNFTQEKIPVPAILIKALSDEVKWQEVQKNIRIGFDILAIVLGVITTATTGNPGILALAIADIAVASTDLVVEGLKEEILELDGGADFLDNWEKIYIVGGIVTAGPTLISSTINGGTRLLRAANNLNKINVTKFVRTALAKVILEIEIANFTKNTVKEIIFGEEVFANSGIKFNTAGISRLQKQGVLFIKGIDFDGNTTGYAAIYKGEAIASGSAKEVRETLMELWTTKNNKLLDSLNELYEISSFVSKYASKLKTNINESFFWSGKTDRIGGEFIALEIAKSKKGITLEGLLEKNSIPILKWDIKSIKSLRQWTAISKKYAELVSGEVRAVIGKRLRNENIWESRELPALKANPNVTKITIIDPKTKKEKIIFKR